MNATEIVTAAQNLPAIPDVVAANMLTAQGYRPTSAEMAAINARADFFRSVGMPSSVTVRVFGFSGAEIGRLVFS